jgi:hypothetical protein
MYKLNQNSVIRLADGASIPFADGNMDYEEYKQWLSEGGIPEPEFTEEELEAKELQSKLSEAKSLLDTTEFKFNYDYDPKDTTEWLELKTKRQEAREFIRVKGQ